MKHPHVSPDTILTYASLAALAIAILAAMLASVYFQRF